MKKNLDLDIEYDDAEREEDHGHCGDRERSRKIWNFPNRLKSIFVLCHQSFWQHVIAIMN
jgi:hypothetical protein